tara:strand:+ start:1545 stop:3800 length:2256 start_codon:yes stop_codon:yes gene_type:complete
MAEKIRIAELNIDDKALLDSLTKTKAAIKELADENSHLRKSGADTSEQFIKNEANLKSLKGEYGKQIKILQATTTSSNEYVKALGKEIKSVDDAAKNNKDLIKVRNQTNASTVEGAAQIAKINKKLNENTEFIKGNVSSLEQQKMNIGNYQSALDGISPKLGMFTSSITRGKEALMNMVGGLKAQKAATIAGAATTTGFSSALKVLKFALIATGIGAIVVVLGSLVGMLANTQKGTDFVSKAMGGLKSALAVITDRISAVGGAFAKFFSGDFEGGFNDLQTALSGIGDEIANESKEAYGLVDALNKLRDAEIAAIATTAERRKEIAKLKLEAKDLSLSLQDRITSLDKANALDKQILAEEIGRAKERSRISQAQTAQGESTAEEIRANEELKAEVFALEEAQLTREKTIAAERAGLINKVTAEEKSAYDASVALSEQKAAKLTEDEKKELDRVKAFEDKKKALLDEIEIANTESAVEKDTLKLEKELEKNLFELERMALHEDEKLALQLLYQDRFVQEKAAIDKAAALENQKVADEALAKTKAQGDAEQAVRENNAQARLGLMATIGSGLKQMFGENTALAKVGLVLEKGAAIASIISQTAIANAKSVAASPLTFGQPFVTANTVAAGASIASVASQTLGSFAKGGILSGASHALGGIKTQYGELEGGEAVINKASTAKYMPLLSAINSAEGGRKFAQGGILGDAVPMGMSGIDYQQLAQTLSMMPPAVVSVEEINNVANRSINVQETGSF